MSLYCMDFYRQFLKVPANAVNILVLVDGFGMNLLEHLEAAVGKKSWFVSHFQQEMRSVYPSTTAVALSALASLREPGELGVSGWTTWLPEHKKLVNMLISKSPLKRYAPGEWDNDIVEQTLLVKSVIGHKGVHLVQPAPYIPQKYAEWTSGGRQAALHGYSMGKRHESGRMGRLGRSDPAGWQQLVWHVARNAEPGELIYLYLPMVDSQSHRSGWNSPETLAVLRAIDEDLEALSRALETEAASTSPTFNIAVTADHGFINIAEGHYHYARDDTPWMQYLESSISGEGRNPVFHVRPGYEDAFKRSFNASAEGADFELLRPEELVAQGHFGERGISAGARPRWGSFVGLAQCRAYLQDLTKNQNPPRFIGHHGGTDPAERRVPLLIHRV